MRKTIAAAAVATSLAAGAVLGVPALAGAAQTATGAVSWVQDALGGLVDDGTITQAQADAVAAALDEAGPARGFGHGHGRHMHLAAVAEVLDTTVDELREALAGGQTIAEVAGDRVDALIDALVADMKARLDQHVADGDLTQEEADERLAGAEERITAMVNGEMPARGGFGGRHHGRMGR